MSKFKTGDKVIAIDSSGQFTKGDILEVSGLSGDNKVKVHGHRYHHYDDHYFSPIMLYPNPPHKHAELIKAWADGAIIEHGSSGGGRKGWCLTQSNPSWHDEVEYRIKPEKTANQLEIERIESEMRKLADDLKALKDK